MLIFTSLRASPPRYNDFQCLLTAPRPVRQRKKRHERQLSHETENSKINKQPEFGTTTTAAETLVNEPQM